MCGEDLQGFRVEVDGVQVVSLLSRRITLRMEDLGLLLPLLLLLSKMHILIRRSHWDARRLVGSHGKLRLFEIDRAVNRGCITHHSHLIGL